MIILSLTIVCMMILFIYQEKNYKQAGRENLSAHSRVLREPLWKIDRETAYQYLTLASRTDSYLEVTVFLHPDEAPFIKITKDSPGGFENILLAIRIYRTLTLESPVSREGEEIGLIRVKILNRNNLLYIIECLFLLFLDSFLLRLLRFLKEKRSLEDRVRVTRGQMEESETRFKTLVENIPGMSYRSMMNENWTMTYISDEVEKVTGYSSGEIMNDRYISFFSLIAPEDRERVTRVVEDAIENRQPFTVEYSLVCRDGSHCWLYDRGKGIFDEKGEIKYIDGVILDITEQKRIKDENELLEQRFNMAQKRESVGRLAGGISHDFNNLLTPILGYSDLLEEEAREKGLTMNYLSEVIHAAERAKRLVQQLLSYSRNQILKNESFPLNDLLLSFELLLKGTLKDNIALKFDLEKEIPPVWADKGQIEQVVMNIVVNARDAMPGGGELTIRTRAGKTQGSLQISDTGTGMDKQVLDHIFEPFYSTKGKLGTGLGLSAAYGIIKQQKGTIEVKSRVGEGTTFHIDLPYARKEENHG